MKKYKFNHVKVETLADATRMISNNAHVAADELFKLRKKIRRADWRIFMLELLVARVGYAGVKLCKRVETLEMKLNEPKPKELYPQIEREEDIGGSHVTVKFDNYELAWEALLNFCATITNNGFMKETDIWKYFGYPFSFSDKGLGWTDISNVEIEKENDLYVIRFPVPYPVS